MTRNRIIYLFINLIVSSLGDGLHVEKLSGVVLNSGQHYDGDALALLLNRIQYIFNSQHLFSLKPRKQIQR